MRDTDSDVLLAPVFLALGPRCGAHAIWPLGDRTSGAERLVAEPRVVVDIGMCSARSAGARDAKG